MENLMFATFAEPSAAHQAMSELRRLDADGTVAVRTAAVLERRGDGRLQVSEEAENVGFTATASGGLVGALLGALAGPLGLLLGGAAGIAVGAVSDADEADASELHLMAVGTQLPAGATAVVADVDEPAPETLDAVVTRLGGKVSRRTHREVEAELEAAEEVVRAAEAEAKRVLRERRKARGEETLGDRVADAKDKITRG